MTDKKSLKSTLTGLGTSGLSLAGVCCGSGACAAACGPVCLAPFASIFGISMVGISAWMSNLLPLFTAISAIAFTIAYFAIYKNKEEEDECCGKTNCCGDDEQPISSLKKNHKINWSKPLFWVGLVLTMGFYTSVIGKNIYAELGSSSACCSAPTEEGAAVSSCVKTTSCLPANCMSK